MIPLAVSIRSPSLLAVLFVSAGKGMYSGSVADSLAFSPSLRAWGSFYGSCIYVRVSRDLLKPPRIVVFFCGEFAHLQGGTFVG